MKRVINPILRGFNPDPSIIRVNADYYIATSTFEWFPGVQIHHSRDLRHWALVAHPLNRISQLDMIGNPDSCGVWAPCLSYDNGTFFLVYSNVRSFDGPWKDTPNYLVTTTDILGEWSEPVYLNSSGFDASLFHDEDGRKWLVNMVVDHRQERLFGGIYLQEYDTHAQKLIGAVHYIFGNTELGGTEAPHLYKKDGYYYLILAEGGTEYGHAITVARSRELRGPYEVHPTNPMISSKDYPEHPLQKAGHGDLVQTDKGEWLAVFLVGRPLQTLGRCTLGRETAIAPIEWREDDWPYLRGGGRVPPVKAEIPDLPDHPFPPVSVRDSFEASDLSIHFQALRIPITEKWASLRARPGFLRLVGRESLSSCHRQSLIARRMQAHEVEAACCLEFSPSSFQQMAGLVCYYNTYHYHYLYLAGSDDGKRTLLHILTCDKYEIREALEEPIDLTGHQRISLKVSFRREHLQCYVSLDEENWQAVGPVLDGSILSDDYVRDEQHRYRPAFTGTFLGMCCQDLSGQGIHADFDWFEYRELSS